MFAMPTTARNLSDRLAQTFPTKNNACKCELHFGQHFENGQVEKKHVREQMR